MWVVDCATDSVLKKFECAPFGADADVCMRWAPWSNRLYLINDFGSDYGGFLVVIDCNTDSVIVPGMLRGGLLRDIQIDPIRRRVFVIGDPNRVYVLRDVEGGVAEESFRLQAAGHQMSLTVVHSLPYDEIAFDAMGRRVVNPRAGIFFVREEPQAASHKPQAVRKVVLQR